MSSSTSSTRRPRSRPRIAAPPSWEPVPAIMVPFGPCPTVPAGDGIPGAWLQDGSELEPALFARASRLRAVSMDMTGGYAKSVREHAPQATIVIDNYHVVALATKALDEVRREHWNELRHAGETDAAKQFKARPLGAAEATPRTSPTVKPPPSPRSTPPAARSPAHGR